MFAAISGALLALVCAVLVVALARFAHGRVQAVWPTAARQTHTITGDEIRCGTAYHRDERSDRHSRLRPGARWCGIRRPHHGGPSAECAGGAVFRSPTSDLRWAVS